MKIKKIVVTVFLTIILAAAAAGQNLFKAGDLVELNINGSQWVNAKIETIDGNIMKVRYGNGKYDFKNIEKSAAASLLRAKGQTAQMGNDLNLQNQFRSEAAKYLLTVQFFAPFYDSNFKKVGLPSQTDLPKMINLLAELDALCKAKYSNIKNLDRPWNKDTISGDNPQTWCAIAAKRNDLEKPFRTETAKSQLKGLLVMTVMNLDKAIKDKDNRTPEETQKLLFSREQWKAEMSAKSKAKFAEFGVEVPSDFFTEVEQKTDQLLELINKTAPNRSWTKPPYNDPAVENFIRAKYPVDPDYKGVKVYKTGLDYTTWKGYESLSYLGNDSNFRYYKVEYNEYKRGWSLIKLPNQPFCQAQEFIVGRKGSQIVLVSLGGSGIFMKCQ